MILIKAIIKYVSVPGVMGICNVALPANHCLLGSITTSSAPWLRAERMSWGSRKYRCIFVTGGFVPHSTINLAFLKSLRGKGGVPKVAWYPSTFGLTQSVQTPVTLGVPKSRANAEMMLRSINRVDRPR